MATVTPTVDFHGIITWANIGNSDTVTEQHIPPGFYNLEVKGTWGGTIVKVLFGLTTAPTVGLSEDSVTPLEFTSDSPVLPVGPIARGYMKPSLSGGAGSSITVTLSPAPMLSSL